LSTREGFKEVDAVRNNSNPPLLWDTIHKKWDEYLNKVVSDVGYKMEEIALLSTGADIDNLGKVKKSFKEFEIVCFATAGVRSNAMRLGKDITRTYELMKEMESFFLRDNKYHTFNNCFFNQWGFSKVNYYLYRGKDDSSSRSRYPLQLHTFRESGYWNRDR